MAKVSIMRMLIGFAAAVMLLEVAAAVDHTVGAPNGGWDLTTDLSTWASSQTFTVGDTLVFQFDSTHDVLEVTKANYDSCGLGNPISTTVTSPDRVSLSASGTRYFVCGRGNHCSQGMKVQINVVAATGPSPPQTTTPSSPTPPGPTTSSSPPPPPPVETPSSAISLKMTAGTILGFGFLVMMLLSL
ncbi:hypothetical protein SSX86_028594 [Deinandra increscens subsp. villosa]|uniref:Phytocyanin domain-containing protein n=1 Tax=Deinandra increscens subsp. villosa TaxID=3103831 RepID=A0AAP0C9Q3_9ASTR